MSIPTYKGERDPMGLNDGERQGEQPFWELVMQGVKNDWATTQEIARRIGVEWGPGSKGLQPVRYQLYALELHGFVDHEPRHNGHLWRRSFAALREDEPPI